MWIRHARRALAAVLITAMASVALPAGAVNSEPTVVGRVLGPDGLPVEGVQVSFGGVLGRVVTQADGSFRLPVTGAAHHLWLQPATVPIPAGRPYVSYAAPLTTSSGTTDVGALVLPDFPDTRLRVVDAAGAPVAGAAVGRRQINLVNPDLGWAGAGVPLGQGLPLTAVRYSLGAMTDSSGQLSAGMPLRSGGGIVDLAVDPPHGQLAERGSTADARPQPDGSYLLVLHDRVRPGPPAPTDVRAEADGPAVRVSWQPPPRQDPAVPVSYEVTDLHSGITVDARTERSLILRDVPAKPSRSYVVRARTIYGRGPASEPSNPVLATATVIRALSGPAEGALVRGTATWRLGSNRPLSEVECYRAPYEVTVTECSDERVTARKLEGGDTTVTVWARSPLGLLIEWTRTVVAPSTMESHARAVGWTHPGRILTTKRRGAWVEIYGSPKRRLHLFARTGPGQGVIEVRNADRVVRRIDLAARPHARSTHFVMRFPVSSKRRTRIEVVSERRRVVLRAFAHAR